jgi:hypothetical protein
MAGQDTAADPAKALEFKEKGNKCFQAGDYHGAEELYSKAHVPLFHPPVSCPSPPFKLAKFPHQVMRYSKNSADDSPPTASPATQQTPSSTPTAPSPC